MSRSTHSSLRARAQAEVPSEAIPALSPHLLPGMSSHPVPVTQDFVALSGAGKLVRWAGVVAGVFILILGLFLVVQGLMVFGPTTLNSFLALAENPLLGLAIGVLVTAAVQSSTTTTALTVVAVGAGAVSVEAAIPIVLGANIGTTITPALVAYVLSRDRDVLFRTMSTALLHILFNGLFVPLAFVAEWLFHPFEHMSSGLAGVTNVHDFDGVWRMLVFTPLTDAVTVLGPDGLLGSLGSATAVGSVAVGIGSVVCGLVLAVVGLQVINRLLRTLMAGAARTLLKRSSGTSDLAALGAGFTLTLILQASSVTVATLLPLAATRTLRERELLFTILGANVGTTVSAVVVGLAVPGGLEDLALQLALVHVLFNVMGVLVVLLVPPVRDGLLLAARLIAERAVDNTARTLAALIVVFFGLPAICLLQVVV